MQSVNLMSPNITLEKVKKEKEKVGDTRCM